MGKRLSYTYISDYFALFPDPTFVGELMQRKQGLKQKRALSTGPDQNFPLPKHHEISRKERSDLAFTKRLASFKEALKKENNERVIGKMLASWVDSARISEWDEEQKENNDRIFEIQARRKEMIKFARARIEEIKKEEMKILSSLNTMKLSEINVFLENGIKKISDIENLKIAFDIIQERIKHYYYQSKPILEHPKKEIDLSFNTRLFDILIMNSKSESNADDELLCNLFSKWRSTSDASEKHAIFFKILTRLTGSSSFRALAKYRNLNANDISHLTALEILENFTDNHRNALLREVSVAGEFWLEFCKGTDFEWNITCMNSVLSQGVDFIQRYVSEFLAPKFEDKEMERNDFKYDKNDPKKCLIKILDELIVLMEEKEKEKKEDVFSDFLNYLLLKKNQFLGIYNHEELFFIKLKNVLILNQKNLIGDFIITRLSSIFGCEYYELMGHLEKLFLKRNNMEEKDEKDSKSELKDEKYQIEMKNEKKSEKISYFRTKTADKDDIFEMIKDDKFISNLKKNIRQCLDDMQVDVDKIYAEEGTFKKMYLIAVNLFHNHRLYDLKRRLETISTDKEKERAEMGGFLLSLLNEKSKYTHKTLLFHLKNKYALTEDFLKLVSDSFLIPVTKGNRNYCKVIEETPGCISSISLPIPEGDVKATSVKLPEQKSGHAVTILNVEISKKSTQEEKKIIEAAKYFIKPNKKDKEGHYNPNLSIWEVLCGCLWNMALPKYTPDSHLILDRDDKIYGVIVKGIPGYRKYKRKYCFTNLSDYFSHAGMWANVHALHEDDKHRHNYGVIAYGAEEGCFTIDFDMSCISAIENSENVLIHGNRRDSKPRGRFPFTAEDVKNLPFIKDMGLRFVPLSEGSDPSLVGDGRGVVAGMAAVNMGFRASDKGYGAPQLDFTFADNLTNQFHVLKSNQQFIKWKYYHYARFLLTDPKKLDDELKKKIGHIVNTTEKINAQALKEILLNENKKYRTQMREVLGNDAEFKRYLQENRIEFLMQDLADDLSYAFRFRSDFSFKTDFVDSYDHLSGIDNKITACDSENKDLMFCVRAGALVRACVLLGVEEREAFFAKIRKAAGQDNERSPDFKEALCYVNAIQHAQSMITKILLSKKNGDRFEEIKTLFKERVQAAFKSGMGLFNQFDIEKIESFDALIAALKILKHIPGVEALMKDITTECNTLLNRDVNFSLSAFARELGQVCGIDLKQRAATEEITLLP